MKNLIVGQSGGPTAAINSSLAGVIKKGLESDNVDKVYGMINGIDGFLSENIINLESFNDRDALKLLRQTPASFLGSCRKKLPSFHENETIYTDIFNMFDKYNIGFFIYIGGNDSMDTVKKLSEYALLNNKDIKIAGIPKTIDNDLAHTDHTPGYGSAAKFIANSIRQLSMDTSVYKMKSIVVAEIMGRNAGWLTGAAALANGKKVSPVDIILLPEAVFDIDNFLDKINDIMKCKDSTIIAVSEGIRDKSGNYFSENTTAFKADDFSHAMLGGVGKRIEKLIHDNLKIKTRSIEFSTLQRCCAQNISLCDYEEAFSVGYEGTAYALLENSGFMAGFKRISNNPYEYKIEFYDIGLVANFEKKVPINMLGDDKMNVNKLFIDYATPLINGEPDLIYSNGVIDVAVL